MDHQTKPLTPFCSWWALSLSPVPLVLGLAVYFFLPAQEGSETVRLTAYLLALEFFLAALFLPLSTMLPGRGDPLLLGATLIITFSIFLALPGELTASVLGQSQLCLGLFGLLLISITLLIKPVHSQLSQLCGTITGLLILSTPLLANSLITSSWATPEPIVLWALALNPLPPIYFQGLEWDFYRMSLLYEHSRIPDYPFAYPTVLQVSWLYFKISLFPLILVGLRHLKKYIHSSPSIVEPNL